MQGSHSSLQKLNDAFLSELTRAMALPHQAGVQNLIHMIFGIVTLRFSEIILQFDSEIEQNGSMAGTRWLLQYFVAGHEAKGIDLIPNSGPLIIASNHPASYDALVITAHVSRPDIKIIIGEIPPYQFLPHVSQHAIFSPPAMNTFGRMQTVRKAIHHLKDGGALLIFPRGGIEPDPSFMPNPDSEFNKWSRSLEILIRNVPETQVLVTSVSGVISQKAINHPITWLRKTRPDKQRLAFIYQMIRQVLTGRELFGLTPRVTFGELLNSTNHENVLTEVEQSARWTISKHLSVFHP